jgi:hypothetical protein
MTKLEKLFYTAKAHSVGGRDDGASRTDDPYSLVTSGNIDVNEAITFQPADRVRETQYGGSRHH